MARKVKVIEDTNTYQTVSSYSYGNYKTRYICEVDLSKLNKAQLAKWNEDFSPKKYFSENTFVVSLEKVKDDREFIKLVNEARYYAKDEPTPPCKEYTIFLIMITIAEDNMDYSSKDTWFNAQDTVNNTFLPFAFSEEDVFEWYNMLFDEFPKEFIIKSYI
jgi:hypothetical protein